MKILIVGDPNGRDDEGMKRVNSHLRSELIALGHHCTIDNGLSLKANWASWDKIVFTAGPTQNTLHKIAAMRIIHQRSEIILTGLMPSITAKRSFVLRRSVDRIVSENPQMLAIAKLNDVPVVQQAAATFSFQKFVRDRDRTKPKRAEGPLRVLHVGHLNEKRNVNELATLCRKLGYSITFLVSSTVKEELEERRRLEALGAEIISEYQEDLYEFYRKFDLYAFPVKRSDAAIAMPLSIIEALLSGLNVLTTDFGEVSANFGYSSCVHITNALDKVTAAQLEDLANRPVMKIEELRKYDTRQLAQIITGRP